MTYSNNEDVNIFLTDSIEVPSVEDGFYIKQHFYCVCIGSHVKILHRKLIDYMGFDDLPSSIVNVIFKHSGHFFFANNHWRLSPIFKNLFYDVTHGDIYDGKVNAMRNEDNNGAIIHDPHNENVFISTIHEADDHKAVPGFSTVSKKLKIIHEECYYYDMSYWKYDFIFTQCMGITNGERCAQVIICLTASIHGCHGLICRCCANNKRIECVYCEYQAEFSGRSRYPDEVRNGLHQPKLSILHDHYNDWHGPKEWLIEMSEGENYNGMDEMKIKRHLNIPKALKWNFFNAKHQRDRYLNPFIESMYIQFFAQNMNADDFRTWYSRNITYYQYCCVPKALEHICEEEFHYGTGQLPSDKKNSWVCLWKHGSHNYC